MKGRILNERKISRIFQTDVNSIERSCKNQIKKYKLKYKILTFKEKEILKKESFLKIKNDKQKIAKPYRKKTWHKGWQENYEEFKKTKNFNSIIPNIIKKKNLKSSD